LDYVDLDIDILVWKDFQYEILDLEEYEQNLITYNYSSFIKSNVTKNIDILLRKIKMKSFPFDFSKDSTISSLK
jgi:protein associated with RNAse G/E